MPIHLTAEQKHQAVVDNLSLGAYYARRFGRSREDRDDLRQEAALALAEAAEKYDLEQSPIENFGRYAGAYVRGRVFKWMSDKRRHALVECPAADDFDPEEITQKRVDPGDVKASLDFALRYLSPRQRAMLSDKYGLDGAEALGWGRLARKHKCDPRSARRQIDEARVTIALALLVNGHEGALDHIGWLAPPTEWGDRPAA